MEAKKRESHERGRQRVGAKRVEGMNIQYLKQRLGAKKVNGMKRGGKDEGSGAPAYGKRRAG